MRRLAQELAVFAFFLALAVLMTWPHVGDMTGRTLWGVDPIIDQYAVHWVASHALDPSQLLGGNIFYPAPHGVLASDLCLGTAFLMIPIRAFVSDPIPLYNVAVLIALAFSGWAFHALVRGLTGSVWAGVLTGVLASYASHQMLHIDNLNLLSTGWLPLFLLALQRMLERPRPGHVVLAGISFVLTALSTGYYAVATVIVALCFLAWHAREWRRASLLAACLAALLATLLMLPYLHAYATMGEDAPVRRSIELSVQTAFMPERDLKSYALLYRHVVGAADRRSLNQDVSFPGQGFFPGLIAPVLAIVAVARRRPRAGFYVFVIAVLLWVSLGPRGGLYRLVFAIPGFSSMRHPYSFAAVAALLLPVLAGLGWASLRLAARPWAGPLIVALAVIETLPPAPRFADWPRGVPPAYAAIAALPPGPILEIPVLNYETMLWAARHGQPVLNGTGAFVPRPTQRLRRAIDAEWLVPQPGDIDKSTPTAMLLALGARYVIVPVGRWTDVKPLAAAFDRSSVFALAAVAADGDRVYVVRR